MSSTPAFAAAPRAAAAILGTAETNLTVPTQASTLLTAGSSGSIITEIVINSIDTDLANSTVAGLVYVFLYDGSTYHLHSTIAISAQGPSSATSAPFRISTAYSNLIIPSGWSLRCSQSIAGNASLLKTIVIGADL